MTLRELANLLDHPRVQGDLTAVVTAVADDSASVEPGALFVAVKGLRHDGHEYVEEAFRRGAVGAVIEQSRLLARLPTAPCLICVSDSRMALRRIAVAFYGEPAGRLRMVGVTGTNGKTTTAYL
ncbi:MAG TPA: Mur ligase domain-containing protein, partial [Nitrospiria bacterium]|nr:Mur ligase domain-containing protein [Nitrospiria bacterium]